MDFRKRILARMNKKADEGYYGGDNDVSNDDMGPDEDGFEHIEQDEPTRYKNPDIAIDRNTLKIIHELFQYPDKQASPRGLRTINYIGRLINESEFPTS